MFKQWTFFVLIFATFLEQGWPDLLEQRGYHDDFWEESNDGGNTLAPSPPSFLASPQNRSLSPMIERQEANSEYDDFLEKRHDSDSPSEPSSSSSSQKHYTPPPTIEVKGGYFFFSNSKMRNIYNKGGVDLQISGSYPIWRWIQIYGSIEYLERHGRSLKGHQKASIWEVPLSLGAKLVAQIHQCADYYFTIGPRYFFVHGHNHSSFVDKTISQNGLGGFAGVGFNFFLIHHLFIDAFGEYSYCRLHFHPSKKHVYGESAQVGGLTFGVGIGYAF